MLPLESGLKVAAVEAVDLRDGIEPVLLAPHVGCADAKGGQIRARNQTKDRRVPESRWGGSTCEAGKELYKQD